MAEEASDLAASVTILFADISGSTALYAERGNVEGHRLTSQCVLLLEEKVRSAHGRVVKRIGDEILAAFETAEPAVQAAAGMQEALDDFTSDLRREGIHVRIGMASGAALIDEGDVFGDVVNVAARIVGLAAADEILLATTTLEALPEDLRKRARLIDTLALRGRAEAVGVYEYLWQMEPEDATLAVSDRTRVLPRIALELQYGTETLVVAASCPKVTIGRDDDNAISIDEQVVSRHHADIVMRGDKFLLVDRSTNGTYVLTDTGDKFRVTRDELSLSGVGSIFAGSKKLDPIRYRTTVR
jgi:class 3 adenylate cyclase